VAESVDELALAVRLLFDERVTSLAVATWILVSSLFADGAVAAPAPAAAPAAAAGEAALDADAWSRRYEQARARMLAGEFAAAAAAFAALASSTRDLALQDRARELSDICGRWAHGGFTLVRSSDLAAVHAQTAAALVDRRSADELGVLYTAAVFYGLGSGAALDVWTQPGSAATGILPVLALGGAAAGVVYWLDSPEDLHYGVAQAITSGMWVGFEEGLAWILWNQARADSANEWSARTVATALWGTATAGAVLGGALGTLYGTTPGRASFVGSAALWSGLVAGLLGATAAQGGGGGTSTADDSFMLTSALGLTAGATAGILLGNDVAPSIARVRFLDLGAIAGGVLFGGLYLAVSNGNPDTPKLTATLAGGIGVGLVTAWQLTTHMEPDYPRHGRAAPSAVSSFTPTLMLAPGATNHASSVAGLLVGVGGGF
jgi:hypothetical protein